MKRRQNKSGGKSGTLSHDVFELEQGPDMNDPRKYGRQDNYEYEVPDDFEDEDIDSDEAFNEEDEAKYGHLFRKKEEQDEQEEREQAELEEAGEGEYEEFPGEAMLAAAQEDEDEDDEDEEGDDEEKQNASEGFLKHLQDKLLKKKKNRGPRSEHVPEGEFSMVPSYGQEDATADQQVLATVLERLGEGPRAAKTREALQKMSKLRGAGVAVGVESAKRMERQIAFKQASKTVSRFQTQVQANRNARSLVLDEEEVPQKVVVNTATLVSQFAPQNAMEEEIQKIIKDSGANEDNFARFEELELNKLDPAEVAARHAYLAKLRSLTFHRDLKNKRLANIKSKKYRKILKRQREKSKPTLDELKAIDPAKYQEELEKLEEERIRERVTMRHRNTGQWAKSVSHTQLSRDPETRQAMNEQLQAHQALRRKMGMYGEDEDDENNMEEGSAEAQGAGEGVWNTSSSLKKKVKLDDYEDDEEDDEDYVPEAEKELPKPSDVAPDFSGSSNVVVAATQGGFKARASGNLTARASLPNGEEGGAEPEANAEEDEEENPAQATTVLVSESAKWINRTIQQQLEPAPAKLLGRKRESAAAAEDRAALVRMAFAEDDAQEAFAEEKMRVEGADEANEEEEVLPGWGSWTGQGIAQRPRRKKQKANKNPDAPKPAAPAHVILAPPKRDPKLHLVEVPFPYTSKEQYEADAALPLGKDWNSRLAFDDLRRPDVVTKAGVYLKPIQYIAPDKKQTKKEKEHSRRPKNLVAPAPLK